MKKLFIAGIVLATSLTAFSGVIFNDDFGSATDGSIGDLPGWEGQASWLVAGGDVTSLDGYSRARNFSTFQAAAGETVKITLSDLKLTGTGAGASGIFAFGFAASTEHSGATTPQVRAEIAFTSSTLSIGGATDSAYLAGSDLVNVELSFTRLVGSGWSLDTKIINTSDTTEFNNTGVTPTDLDGSAGASTGLTVSEWLDADGANTIRYGMRGINNTTLDNTLSVGGIKVEVIPEPATLGLVAIFGGAVLFIRRRFMI